jgi:hypothetical protein
MIFFFFFFFSAIAPNSTRTRTREQSECQPTPITHLCLLVVERQAARVEHGVAGLLHGRAGEQHRFDLGNDTSTHCAHVKVSLGHLHGLCRGDQRKQHNHHCSALETFFFFCGFFAEIETCAVVKASLAVNLFTPRTFISFNGLE